MAKQKKAPQVAPVNTTTTGADLKKNSDYTTNAQIKQPFNENKLYYGLLIFLLLLVVVIRLNFISIPFERDEGAYSYYGKLLAEGKIPYKDFYEQKFPGIFYLYAIVVSVFGDSVEGMHRGFMLINLATIYFLFAAAKKMFSPLAGIVTACSYALLSLTPTLCGFTIQSEHGVALFTSLGLLFYATAKASEKWRDYLFMGLAMGTAFMVKTSGVFLVAAGGLFIITDFLFSGKREIKTFLIKAGSYAAGVASIALLLLLVIVAKGSFKEMMFWAIEIPKHYVGKIPFSQGKGYLKLVFESLYQDHKYMWILAGMGILSIVLPTVKWSTKAFIVLLAILSALTVFPGFYFYGHYFIQTLPGVAFVGGFAVHAIVTFIATKTSVKSSIISYVCLGLYAVFTLMHIENYKGYYFTPDYENILRTVYGTNPFPESYEVANHLNGIVKPEEQVLVFGSEPEIYFYMKKKSPSRHAYFSAIVDNIPEHKKWQREFVSDVEKVKPEYLVVFHNAISILAQPNTDQYVFNWLNKYIPDHYDLIGIVDQLNGEPSKYLWNQQTQGYKPVSENVVYVLKRRSKA